MSKKNKKKHHNNNLNYSKPQTGNNQTYTQPQGIVEQPVNSAPQSVSQNDSYRSEVNIAPQPVYRSEEHYSHKSESIRKSVSVKQSNPFGVFLLIVMIITLLVATSVVLNKTIDNQGLKNSVEKVLKDKGLEYKINHQLPVSNGLASGTAVYDLGSGYFAVIIRTTSIYGPLPAVFIYKLGDTEAKFIDYCLVDSLAKERIIDNTQNNQISFWAKRIIKIVDEAVTEEALQGGGV